MGFQAGDENIKRYVGNSTTIAIDPTGLDFLDNYANWFNSQVGTDYSTTVGAGIHTVFNQVGVSDQTLANADPFVLTAGTIVASTAIVLGGEVLLGVGTIGQAALAASVAVSQAVSASMAFTLTLPTLTIEGGLGLSGAISLTGVVVGTTTIQVNGVWIVATVLAMSARQRAIDAAQAAGQDAIEGLSSIAKKIKQFEGKSISDMKDLYQKMQKTYDKHLAKYARDSAETRGETNRIEREMAAMRKILEGRKTLFDSNGNIIP